jgi:hypothetical protein
MLISGIFLRIVYLRLRPYIQAISKFLKTFREIGELDPFQDNDSIQKKQSTNEKLVRCSSCGVWTPESRAVKLKSNVFYCSHSCLESAAEPIKQKRRSSF